MMSKLKKIKATGDDAPGGKMSASLKSDAGVGRRAELRDDERAIGRPIKYADDRHPMQSAPDHGPHK